MSSILLYPDALFCFNVYTTVFPAYAVPTFPFVTPFSSDNGVASFISVKILLVAVWISAVML